MLSQYPKHQTTSLGIGLLLLPWPGLDFWNNKDMRYYICRGQNHIWYCTENNSINILKFWIHYWFHLDLKKIIALQVWHIQNRNMCCTFTVWCFNYVKVEMWNECVEASSDGTYKCFQDWNDLLHTLWHFI
jgi:hypothetical protein